MNDTRLALTFGNREIILIGTAHVSKESIDEVRKTILEEKPACVCVELDEARYNAISKKDNWENNDMMKVFREGRGFLLIANLVLSGIQRRMGTELGVKPGEEMITALQTAEEQKIPHSLCDRSVQTTLRRAWSRCNMWSKSKLLASLLTSAFSTEKLTSEEIEKLKERSELDSMIAELAEYLPAIKETLIDERDKFLAAKIWTTAKEIPGTVNATPAAGNETSGTAGQISETAETGKRIIAVVGAGHMQGIKSHLEKIAKGDEGADVSGLDKIPPPTLFSKLAGLIVPSIIVALIVLGFFRVGVDMSLAMVLRWILWNGSLAALGSLLALGHPLAILVSFVGAPIATLNPFIGVGLFSGVTQVTMRKPRVIDAQNINLDIGSIKGIYRNRILRALLVFFLSSIGGVAGNFISIPALAGVLFG